MRAHEFITEDQEIKTGDIAPPPEPPQTYEPSKSGIARSSSDAQKDNVRQPRQGA